MTEVLKQDDLNPLPVERQVALFYAALNGYFDHLEIHDVKKAEVEFLDYLEKLREEDILKPLREKGELTPEIEEALKTAAQKFIESH